LGEVGVVENGVVVLGDVEGGYMFGEEIGVVEAFWIGT